MPGQIKSKPFNYIICMQNSLKLPKFLDFIKIKKLCQDRILFERLEYCGFKWSGREDLNLRHPAPKAGALPGCATPRKKE